MNRFRRPDTDFNPSRQQSQDEIAIREGLVVRPVPQGEIEIDAYVGGMPDPVAAAPAGAEGQGAGAPAAPPAPAPPADGDT